MTTVWLSRSAWGALPPNRESPQRTTTTHVFVHHSATPAASDVEGAKAQWRLFQADHLARTVTLPDGTVIPWADIAYNIGVGPGVILEGRGWDVRGGGTGPGQRVLHPSGSWDNISVSICVIGNYQTDLLDDATREALLVAFRETRRLFPGDLTVMVDRDVNYTSCCGDNLVAEIPALWAESGEDDMATPDEIWAYPLTIEGVTAPAGEWLGYLYAEVTRPDKLTKRVADEIAQRLTD